MEDDEKIRANIRALREKRGLSQAALGTLAGFGQTDISKLEGGGSKGPRSKLTLEKIMRIAKALGEPVSSIVPNYPISVVDDPLIPSVPSAALIGQHMFGHGLPPLPIRGIAQGGDGGAHMLPVGSAPIDYTSRPAILANVPDAYALFVWEDSMSPMYKHGWTMWVHPHQPAAPDDGVIIIKKDGAVLVKELVRRSGGQVRVRQYKPAKEFDIPQAEIAAIHRVVGCLQGR